MTNADWWTRVVKARTAREDLLPRRVWALRKGEHDAAIDVKAVPGIGPEIVLTLDGSGGTPGCSAHTSRRRHGEFDISRLFHIVRFPQLCKRRARWQST
jgi:hypothetical protein